ncbi:MAG: hypothetical protein KUG50_02385, partial [Cycloclasticus sp.]|nr:hypothetical protein [Cycloclasticus sp.]
MLTSITIPHFKSLASASLFLNSSVCDDCTVNTWLGLAAYRVDLQTLVGRYCLKGVGHHQFLTRWNAWFCLLYTSDAAD